MAGIMDYLAWRGDIPFDCDGVNEVDNLIFSMLVYVNFQGIVPADPGAQGITLRDAAKEFFFTYDDKEKYPLGLIIPKEIISIFRKLADTPRYADLYLTGYVNEICEAKEMQFSAITVRLPGDHLVVSFRGTDDTLVGWKEDFKLTYMAEVPSQRKAVEYLDSLVFHSENAGLYVTGHSKGGNLSVWATVHAERAVRDRVVRVYSNDGPGFTKEMLQSEAYLAMADRFDFFVPQSSLVGLLLFHDGRYQVVKSRARGVYQHNPLSWEVMGASVVRAEALDDKAKKTEARLRERLGRMNNDERRMLVELLFDVIEAAGAKTLVEFNEGKLRRAFAMVRAVSELSKENKETTQYLLSKVFDMKISIEPTASANRDALSARGTPSKTTRRAKKGKKAKIRFEWRWQATTSW